MTRHTHSSTVLMVAATLIWGCGAGSSANELSVEEEGVAGGSPTTSTGEGGQEEATFASGGGTPGEYSCSADLHSVVDGQNNLIVECPPDQGCGASGQCVPACQAAEDNASTIGCDYYSVTPAIIPEGRGSCFAVMIANTWNSPVSVQADYAGQPIDTASYLYVPQGQGASLTYEPAGGVLEPGEFGILFLSKYESGDMFQVDCPAVTGNALEMSTQVDTTGRGSAFRITTDRPVVAYDVYPWGGASSYATSATLLVPTPTWGTNFVTADAWEANDGLPFTQVVAAQDDTTVTVVPTVNVQGGGTVPSMVANTPTDFTINRGEVVQFLQYQRLAGSTLQSDKPISVWGGASCMDVPTGVDACDAAHQQLLPVSAVGHEYAVVRYPARGGNDSAPITLIGMVDDTQLNFDPMPTGAPATLARGEKVIFSTDQPFHVVSQDEDHPFYLAAHMTGGTTAGGLGDPEYVNVVPPAQYLERYLFVTDPTYSHTALALVRRKAPDGTFKDVTLDCLGPVTDWVALDSSGRYEVARVMLVENHQGVGSCHNGVHTAESEVPFGLTVWGYDSYASYAYPAGMSVQPINTVVVPPVPR